jgi:hypothetical protein
MANQQLYHIVDAAVQTINGSAQVSAVTFDVSTSAPGGGALNNCSIFVNGTATGLNSGASKASGERVAALFKVVSGTLSQSGSTQHVTGMISDETPACNTGFSVSGNVITYWITGSSGSTINWLARIDFTIYQNS